MQENPAARILILTGSNKEEDVAAALAIGAMGYVQKGASGREIINAIRTVYRGQPYVTQELASRMLVQQSRAAQKPASTARDPLPRPARAFVSSRSWTLLQRASTTAKLQRTSA